MQYNNYSYINIIIRLNSSRFHCSFFIKRISIIYILNDIRNIECAGWCYDKIFIYFISNKLLLLLLLNFMRKYKSTCINFGKKHFSKNSNRNNKIKSLPVYCNFY